MKHIYFIPIIILFSGIFTSCTTDVEIYADYKDVPIIYGMLDYRADTNFVKITRAFCGTNDNPINANEVALISDSSNYPDKLDVRIIEMKSTSGDSYQPTGREFVLDTLTIHDKEEGVFYSPDQMLYYTTEQFNTGTNVNRYKYRLFVVKPDGDTVTAQTGIVGNEEFSILSGSVGFQLASTDAMGRIIFKADGMASLYDVKMQFNYSEQHAGQEVKWKNVSRSFGTKTINEYHRLEGTTNTYYLEYSMNWLFNALENAIGGDTVVNGNHPNVIRHIGDFVLSISAGGDELNLYFSANQAQLSSPISLVSIYSNIDGGYGLFSSRTTIEKTAKLSYYTQRDIFSVTAWGFREQ
jgi:hypothetical protein